MHSLTAPRYAEVCWKWEMLRSVSGDMSHRRTVNERVGLEATSENQSWIAVEAPTVRNPGSSFASHRRHPREFPIHETLT